MAQDASSGDSPQGRSAPEPRIDKYFRAVIKMGASDLHLKAGASPRVRIKGNVQNIPSTGLTSAQIEDLVFEIITPEQKALYLANGSLDLAHEVAGSDRFRINVFRQRGLTSMAARRVSKSIPSFAELHLPPIIETLANMRQGLILVCGITGSGKSTTIAAMIEHINLTRPCHIVTVEDPIEYLHEDKQAFINQREIGIDVPDFPLALRYLIRQDPDVVVIGEMRDMETCDAALRAAETGHLAFGTVHAGSTVSTFTRILDIYPESSRELVRLSLLLNLRAVIGLKLLPGIAPGVPRVPAVEVLIINPAVRKLIQERRDNEIIEVIRSDRQGGMQDFNGALEQLVRDEMIELNEALAQSPNANELQMRLKGIRTSAT